jgi:hypothetical protein
MFNSANSLFAIPANQEFVYSKLQLMQMKDKTANMVNSLVEFCQGKEKPNTPVSSLLPAEQSMMIFDLNIDVYYRKNYIL